MGSQLLRMVGDAIRNRKIRSNNDIDTMIISQSFKTSNYLEILQNISPSLIESIESHKVQSKELPKLKNLIVIDQSEDNAPSKICRYSELIDRFGNLELVDQFGTLTHFDDVINIQFTSGTTGVPKGSMSTHHNIIQNSQFVSRIIFENFLPNQFGETPIVCVPNPLYHAFGCVIGSTSCIYSHASMVLPGPVFNVQQTLETIEQYRCNFLYGTPTMWSDIISNQFDRFDLSSLKRGVISGAPCPPFLIRNIHDKIPSLEHLSIPYGSTEIGPVATSTRIKDSDKHRLESVGKPIPYVEVKIIDIETGSLVPRGTKGEICVRSHGTFPGYINQPEKTREVIDENFWYHTGDIGFMDSQGYLFITGRLKEMIIRGGENIYPREVEELILNAAHPSIKDVQVVGVPDDRLGEELVAYILLDPNVPLHGGEQEMKDFLQHKMSHFKIPKYIRFVADYPRTSSGKIRKVELKEMAAKQFTRD
uniref:Medium-chain acyl-CoA ligase ACSF2, mitochondrial n=1 Tax=Sarcoptes scabiei TaxID=52283 RepID=A0A834VGV3_SARSC